MQLKGCVGHTKDAFTGNSLHPAVDPDRCHLCIGTGQIVPKLNFNQFTSLQFLSLVYKMKSSIELTIDLI